MATYEAHITFPGSLSFQVSQEADEGWKFSKMSGDPVLGDGEYCYLTMHCDDVEKLRFEVHMMVETTRLVGLDPLRAKIEQDVWDERY